jgi:hypothetical protein
VEQREAERAVLASLGRTYITPREQTILRAALLEGHRRGYTAGVNDASTTINRMLKRKP